MRSGSRGRSPGLALGGGASRGWAHLGVIRLLHEAGIEPCCVSGTSIGSVVGALLASRRLETAEPEIIQADLFKILSYVGPRLGDGGLIDSWKVHNLLRAWFGHADIEDLPMPFSAVATNLHTGEEIVMRSGDLVSALMASIAIPVVFPPRYTHGVWLIDGGLVDPVPVGPARDLGADPVIGVDLNGGTVNAPVGVEPEEILSRKPPIHETLLAALTIAERNLTRMRLSIDRPDVLIQPDLSGYHGTEFHKAEEISMIGYEAARSALPEIAGLLGRVPHIAPEPLF